MSLILPPHMHDEKPVYRCEVPTSNGKCGAQFFKGQESLYEKHVIDCADRHAEEIQNASLRHRLSELYDTDHELEEYARRHGRV